MSTDQITSPSPLSELHLPVLPHLSGTSTLTNKSSNVQPSLRTHAQLGPALNLSAHGMINNGQLCWAVRTADWCLTADQLSLLLPFIGAEEAERVLYQRQVRSLLPCTTRAVIYIVKQQCPLCCLCDSQPEDRTRALARYVRSAEMIAPIAATCVLHTTTSIAQHSPDAQPHIRKVVAAAQVVQQPKAKIQVVTDAVCGMLCTLQPPSAAGCHPGSLWRQ
jgi:hypothetical protein